MSEQAYHSTLRWHPEHASALAIFCSDSRFADHCEAFVTNALGVPRFDRFIVPGGAAWLVWHWKTPREQDVARQQIRYLIEAHRILRIIIIAHQDCGFYKARYPDLSDEARQARQIDDLKGAMQELMSLSPAIKVDAYYAGVSGGAAVVFESVG